MCERVYQTEKRYGLERWQKKCHVFTGVVGPVSYQRQVLFDIEVKRDDGQTVGGCDHILVAIKPFKKMRQGTKVRFTGEIKKYYRADGTHDYSVIVNKAKPLPKA